MNTLENKSFFGRPILEPYGKGMVHLTNLHAHIHAGKAFSVRVHDAAVSASGVLMLQFKIPSGVDAHLKSITVYTDGNTMKFELIEDPTITDGTSAANVRNFNRNFLDDPNGITVFTDPTGISGGAVVDEFELSSGATNVAAGGVGSEVEWDLKDTGSIYLLRLTNDTVSAANMYMRAIFYL